MQHILSQIPQSIIEMYGIKVDTDFMYITNVDFIGITNPNISVEEDEFVIKLRSNTYIYSMWKKSKTTLMTLL